MFMEKIKKLFGGIDLTFGRLIIFAICSGIYTSIMALIPFLSDTSFHDIAVTFEVWILFGIIIIMNSKSARDSAIKCFVFFLISQPLVYLIQVPFSSLGFGIFVYYRYWFIFTILTIFMGYIGYYMKRDKWYSILILTSMLLLLGYGSYYTYLKELLFSFPYHLLTVLFCLITLVLYPLCIFNNKRNRVISLVISLLIIIVFTIMAFSDKKVYNATLLANGSYDVIFDDNSIVYLDNDIGDVYIRYDEGLMDYVIEGNFRREGTVNLVLIDKNGERVVFEVNVGNDTFDIKRK